MYQFLCNFVVSPPLLILSPRIIFHFCIPLEAQTTCNSLLSLKIVFYSSLQNTPHYKEHSSNPNFAFMWQTVAALESTVYYRLGHILHTKMIYYAPWMSLGSRALQICLYLTTCYVHSWIKRDQLDVTCFIISLFNAQHVSDVNTSILRSLRLICW